MLSIVDVSKHDVPLFNMIAIEASALCNRSCVFCPNHGTDRPDEIMPMAMIEKMADELAALRYNGRITTYIYNEPMRDKRFNDVLRLLRSRVPRAHIMVSTNGDYIKSHRDIEKIYDAGADQLLVNIYSASDGCGDPKKQAKGEALAAARYGRMKEWMAAAGADQNKSVYAKVKPGSRIGKVDPKFGISAEMKKIASFELQNRAGNIPWFQPPTEPLDKMCVRPWRMLNINWRGDGILCCNDYHGDVNLGNVASRSLVEVWNAPAMHKYRLYLQNKRRGIALCDKCDFGGGMFPHMIHPVTLGSAKADAEALR
jgi:MoaA/NifB/PqqE/SkfB family radical SAM enzyme